MKTHKISKLRNHIFQISLIFTTLTIMINCEKGNKKSSLQPSITPKPNEQTVANLNIIKELIQNIPKDNATRASLGIINTNNYINAYSGLSENPSNPLPKQEETVSAIIDNFASAVTQFNDFVKANNSKSCESMTNIWGNSFPNCQKTTWIGYNNLGELNTLFDHTNNNMNKIRLALFFGNAWNESGGNMGLFNYCMQLKPSTDYPYSKCPKDSSVPSDANEQNPFYFCNGTNCQYIGAGIIQISYISNYANVANILSQINGSEQSPVNPPLCNSPAAMEAGTSNCSKDAFGKDTDSYTCPVQSIVSAPYQVCTYTNQNLAMLTSLIYESAQAERALRDYNYHSSIEFCSVNQGGYTYPYDTKTLNNLANVISTNSCSGLENGNARWDGFITILQAFFGDNIKGDIGSSWSIDVGLIDGIKKCYIKKSGTLYAELTDC